MARSHGFCLYLANDGVTGEELWRSDGTPTGTVRVKDIASGAAHSSPSGMYSHNGFIYFSADDDMSGVELWRSDGTVANTNLVKDIFVGANSSYPDNFTSVENKLYFVASTSLVGTDEGIFDDHELWMTDGTETGTTRVLDIAPGIADSRRYSWIRAVGERRYRRRYCSGI